MSVEKMKTKTTSQLAELGKKTDAINQLKKELGEKTATIFALEARDKTLREQLRATEEEFEIKSGSLREAERLLADKEAELVKLVAELGEHSIIADNQRVELAALRTQVEAMKVSVANYDRTVKDIEHRLQREREDANTTSAHLTEGIPDECRCFLGHSNSPVPAPNNRDDAKARRTVRASMWQSGSNRPG